MIEALRHLMMARTSSAARVAADLLVADHGYRFVPFGHRATIEGSNSAVLKLGERVQNSQDAMIELGVERALLRGEDAPGSPQEAVLRQFGVAGLAGVSSDRRAELAENIVVALTPGDTLDNVIYRDYGCGQTHAQVPQTLGGVHKNAKTAKPYTIGTWHDGSAKTLRWSDSTLILTRRSPDLLEPGDDDRVSIMFIVKVPWTKAEETHWLTLTNNEGQVPWLTPEEAYHWDLAAEARERKRDKNWVPSTGVPFRPGTAITHFEYQGISPQLINVHGNSPYRDFERICPEPFLPYLLVELRNVSEKPRKRTKATDKVRGATRKVCKGGITRILDNMARPHRAQNNTSKLNCFEASFDWLIEFESRSGAFEKVGVKAFITKRIARTDVEAQDDRYKLPTKTKNDGNAAGKRRKGRVLERPLTTWNGRIPEQVIIMQDTFTVHLATPDWYMGNRSIIGSLRKYMILYVDLSTLSRGLQREMVSSDRTLRTSHEIVRRMQKAIQTRISGDAGVLAVARDRYEAERVKGFKSPGSDAFTQNAHAHVRFLRSTTSQVSKARSQNPTFPNPKGPFRLITHSKEALRAHVGGTITLRLGCNAVPDGTTPFHVMPRSAWTSTPASITWTDSYGEARLKVRGNISQKDIPSVIYVSVPTPDGVALEQSIQLRPLGPKAQPSTNKGGGATDTASADQVSPQIHQVTAKDLPPDWPSKRLLTVSINDADEDRVVIDIPVFVDHETIQSTLYGYSPAFQMEAQKRLLQHICTTALYRVRNGKTPFWHWTVETKPEFEAMLECSALTTLATSVGAEHRRKAMEPEEPV